MFASLWGGGFGFGTDERDGDRGAQSQQQDQDADQQPDGRVAPDQATGNQQQQAGSVPLQGPLLALWERRDQGDLAGSAGGSAAAAGQGAGGAAAGASGQAQSGSGQGPSLARTRERESETWRFEEDPEERAAERQRQAAENPTKVLLEQGRDLETVGEAAEYCKALVEAQLKRAEELNPPMNEAISGDSQTRRAIATLLPDSEVRALFLATTRNQRAWPRLRPLFGVPPYNFLRPEDAGLVRAAGIASGRTNMAYEQAGQTANYSQFGAGHLVDAYEREYRMVPVMPPKGGDTLPFDLENIPPSAHLYMNVRVPKRSLQEKQALMKDQAKRRAVVFPFVGEELVVQYSTGLRAVWRSDKVRMQKTRIVVTRLIPRSSNASTAAVVAVRVQ